MAKRRISGKALLTAIAWMGLGAGVARAQSPGSTAIQQGQSIPAQRSTHGEDDSLGLPPGVSEKNVIARNTERQKKLVEDTDKLLELATQLKADVDKTDKNTLSLDVIKRAEQIEKLAHSVKERMKG